VSVRPASLDAPIGEEGDSTTFGEIVGDENAATPFEQLRESNQNNALRALVDSLDPREAEIIRYRFGLDGRDELTLEEVGAKFRVTRERVRQLQNLALSKMRKALSKQEEQRTLEDIELEEKQRAREEVIREFIVARSPSSPEATVKPHAAQLARAPQTSQVEHRIITDAPTKAERKAGKSAKPAKPVLSMASPFAPKAAGKLGAKLYGNLR
jgi:RNA polymerase primary sigma factor